MIRLSRYALLALHFGAASLAGVALGLVRPFHPSNSRLCARLYGNLGLRILGMRVNVSNTHNFPTDRSYVVICNHQSNWDLLVVGQAVPERTVSVGKKSLKWIPLFGQLYWLAGNILIDRGNHKKAMESMATTKRALLEKDTNIWFFAEGTRNHGNNMLPFRKGGFVTAINAGVPIVRVCVAPYLEQLKLDKLDNGELKIEVLPPIETSGIELEDVEDLMQQCHQSMLAVITAE